MDSPFSRPEELEAWLDALPVAQMLDAGRSLAQCVSRLATAELLGLARPVADVLLQGLDSVYSRAPQPLAPHAREALNVARALAAALAGAHERAAAAVPSEEGTAALLRHALRYQAESMRASYRTYSRVPPGAWRSMHELILRGERCAAGTDDVPEDASLPRIYGEALLLSLTDPHRLLSGEIDRAAAILRALPAAAVLCETRPATAAGAHFIVPCGEDMPPRPASPDEPIAAGMRVLDANPVVDALAAAQRELGSGDSAAARLLGPGTVALLAKLSTLWSNPPKRADRRDPGAGSVAICVGVKAIAQFVAHDATADGDAELSALRRGITMPLRTLPEDESGRIVPIHEWAVINLSEHGLKVRRSSRTTTAIAVGDVVGVKAAGKALWAIGVARWIGALEGGTTEFGVQFFADAVCAIWIRTAGGGTRRLGILLHEGEEPGREVVLAPPGTFVAEREFQLRGEDYRARVRATGLVEGNARFDLFHVVPS